MTALKVQEKYSYGWRMAIVIGFISGFLNEKILAAFSAIIN